MKQSRYIGNKQFSVGEAASVEPGPDEVRIQVAWCGICGTDMHIFHGRMDARVKPQSIIGHEMSGVINALGSKVTGFSVGEEVTVRPLNSCGTCAACRNGYSHICMNLKFIGIDSPGAFQEYWNVPSQLIHRLPRALPLDHGALIEPLAVACHDIRRGKLVKGDRAVVLGGGPIGIFVALAARSHGAEVALVEIDAKRREFAVDLGFTTFDPASDVVDAVTAWSGGTGADVVFECTAAAACAELMTRLVRVRGRVVVVGIFSKPAAVDLQRVFWREVEIIGARVYEECNFEEAIALASAGKLPLEKMISHRASLDDIQSAFEHSGGGMKTLVQCSAARGV